MRIPDFKITDEKTKTALVGYVTLLTKDQTRVVTARLAEVNEALEKGDLDMARERSRGAIVALMAIMKTIGDSADLLGVEDSSLLKAIEDSTQGCLMKASSDPLRKSTYDVY